jgi:hypothetical protein
MKPLNQKSVLGQKAESGPGGLVRAVYSGKASSDGRSQSTE